jgi:hypothetical protein
MVTRATESFRGLLALLIQKAIAFAPRARVPHVLLDVRPRDVHHSARRLRGSEFLELSAVPRFA